LRAQNYLSGRATTSPLRFNGRASPNGYEASSALRASPLSRIDLLPVRDTVREVIEQVVVRPGIFERPDPRSLNPI